MMIMMTMRRNERGLLCTCALCWLMFPCCLVLDDDSDDDDDSDSDGDNDDDDSDDDDDQE